MAMNSLSATVTNPSAPTSGYAVYQAHKRQRLDSRQLQQDQQTDPNTAAAHDDDELDKSSVKKSPHHRKSGEPQSCSSLSGPHEATITTNTTSAPASLTLSKESSWSTVLENVNVDNFGGLGPMPPMNTVLEKRTSSQFSIGSLLPGSSTTNQSQSLPGMNMNVTMPMTGSMNLSGMGLTMNTATASESTNSAETSAGNSSEMLVNNNLTAMNGEPGADGSSAMSGTVSPGNVLATSTTTTTTAAATTNTTKSNTLVAAAAAASSSSSSTTTSGDYMYPENVKPMTFNEKQRLVHKITLLPGQYLRGLMDVISKYQPDTVRQIDDDGYAFDLGQMNENTVWAINDYVKESMIELDGYMKTVASANFALETGADPSTSMDIHGTLVTSNQLNSSGKALQPHVQRDGTRHHHPSIQMPVNPVKMSAIYQNENQNKFMEQVEMYSKPKVTKSRVKPSKKHECPTCKKQFRGRSELQNHIRTHTGEKPLKCSYEGCNKRYAHSSNLRAHERSHAGVKPYACHYDGCGKSFAHSVSLKEHIWMHAGFQPYECPYEGCGKKFTQVSNFARHKKTHEKEEVPRPNEQDPESE